ncbi:hypothetical protein NB037_18590 [Rathayibacter sp. ZW T2_19]|uniref:Uncharacterized protein n=1 Tax=Rathayibacter rubneri TaxID=2950106 RepID=A0A9X2IU55_9MICO|nr:hypothetical protein [Rathayibacter rubneri]MCM6764426.1 hypothetical protein [Rathayibacter rubneri]
MAVSTSLVFGWPTGAGAVGLLGERPVLVDGDVGLRREGLGVLLVAEGVGVDLLRLLRQLRHRPELVEQIARVLAAGDEAHREVATGGLGQVRGEQPRAHPRGLGLRGRLGGAVLEVGHGLRGGGEGVRRLAPGLGPAHRLDGGLVDRALQAGDQPGDRVDLGLLGRLVELRVLHVVPRGVLRVVRRGGGESEGGGDRGHREGRGHRERQSPLPGPLARCRGESSCGGPSVNQGSLLVRP